MRVRALLLSWQKHKIVRDQLNSLNNAKQVINHEVSGRPQISKEKLAPLNLAQSQVK